MKYLLAALTASTILAFTPAMAAGNGAPNYEKGTVWQSVEVQTKDGHFDQYMQWISTEWKAQEEALKKDGQIVDYKVMIVTDPRYNEPDILLLTEYKNMAAFDEPVAKEYAMAEKLFGPLAKMNKEQADRASIRTVMGTTLMREVKLK